jgi:hypothetical protein
MDIIEILKADYARFPVDQTFAIYAADVYFKDPLNEFHGIQRYQKMIGFIQTWFRSCTMDLHNIQRQGDMIRTDWTLTLEHPFPWKLCIAIAGWSELTLNTEGLIISHIDYWHGSRWDMLKQHFGFQPSNPGV